MNRNIKNLRRLSGAAMRKLPAHLDMPARTLREVILSEDTNLAADRCTRGDLDPAGYEASAYLNCSREIASKLGQAYRDAHLTGFALGDWYQACGLTKEGELYEGLFEEGDA
jgi:hypothetical protein